MQNTFAPKVFTFEGKQLRTVVDENGEPLFVAKDVCDILEMTLEATRRLDKDEKGLTKIQTLGGIQDMTMVNEAGLYTLLVRSNKEQARPFRRWVTHEVLPSIRKYGMYATPAKIDDILGNPDAFIKVLEAYKLEKAKREALEAEVEEDKPKVIFAEALSTSKSSILVGSLAKILKQNGIDTDPIKLFEWIRQHGYLSSQRGKSWNMPTQKSLDMKLFEIRKSVTTNPDGTQMIHFTTKVTPKGQIYFVNKFKEQEKKLHSLVLNEETLR